MSLTIEERVAVLEAKVSDRDKVIEDMAKDVKLLLAKANQAKGGWAVIAAFSAVAGAVGGLVGMFVKGSGP